MGELGETSVEGRMLEVEEAARNNAARARLDEIKAQLGIEAAPAAAELPASSEPTPGT